MRPEVLELWWMARSDHLRADPQPRSRAVLIFAAKGYTPRKQGNIFEPDCAANSQLPGEEHA